MEETFKKIIIGALEVTPGVISLAEFDNSHKTSKLVAHHNWSDHILITEADKKMSAKITIIINANVLVKTVVQELTSYVLYHTKQAKIRVGEFNIYVRGVSYESK